MLGNVVDDFRYELAIETPLYTSSNEICEATRRGRLSGEHLVYPLYPTYRDHEHRAIATLARISLSDHLTSFPLISYRLAVYIAPGYCPAALYLILYVLPPAM